MTDNEEAREAFERVCELFGEMARSLRLLGESMSSAAEAFAVFAAVVGHPIKCDVPCAACDDEDEYLASVEKSMKESDDDA